MLLSVVTSVKLTTMPKNRASLRILQKGKLRNEASSEFYTIQYSYNLATVVKLNE